MYLNYKPVVHGDTMFDKASYFITKLRNSFYTFQIYRTENYKFITYNVDFRSISK